MSSLFADSEVWTQQSLGGSRSQANNDFGFYQFNFRFQPRTAGNNLAGTNLAGTNLAGTNSGYNIHGLSGEMTGMLYSGEDLALPKAAQCIVLGIGSTAFAKLLGQQSANAKISVALGRLPWGFAKTKGGALTLVAWEALIWGDKTY